MKKILPIFCEYGGVQAHIGSAVFEGAAGEYVLKKIILITPNDLNFDVLKKSGKKQKGEGIRGGEKRKGEPAAELLNYVCPINQKYSWLALMQNWVLWREKELKKPYKTQRGIEAAYKRLVKLSGGDINIAEDIISRSIDREWRDLYALPSQAFGAAEKDLFNEISAAEAAAKRQDEQAARAAALQKLREGQQK